MRISILITPYYFTHIIKFKNVLVLVFLQIRTFACKKKCKFDCYN